jgi:hypothetical protein
MDKSRFDWIYPTTERYTLNLNSIAVRGDMSTGKLILYSSKGELPLSEPGSLIKSLRDIKLIGEPLDIDNEVFLTGDNFLHLISFVGCSTNVCLAPKPDNNGDFCHIAIQGPYSRPKLSWDSSCRPPNCPSCKKPITSWQQQIDLGKLRCPQCKTESQLDEFAWGRQAGYGHIFIQIHNIFPGEARPQHSLLEKLNRITGTEWSYFFTER